MKFPVKSLLAGNFHICFERVTSWSPALRDLSDQFDSVTVLASTASSTRWSG